MLYFFFWIADRFSVLSSHKRALRYPLPPSMTFTARDVMKAASPNLESITQGPSSMNMLPRVAAIRQCQHEAVDRRLCSDISFIIAALRRASGLTKVDFALCANYLILNRLPTNPFPSFVGEKIARPIASAAVAHRFY